MRFLTRHLKNYLWICRLRLSMQRANQLWRLLLIMARPMALLSLMIVLSSARKLVTPPLWRLWNSKIRTGGAFLFDNILLLRSWAFEGFSNYQVSRSWAKIKKNKRVYCYDSTSFKTSKPCYIIFSVYCRRVYQYLCNVIRYPWRKNEKNNIIGGTGSCSIYRYVIILNSIENLDAFTYGKS